MLDFNRRSFLSLIPVLPTMEAITPLGWSAMTNIHSTFQTISSRIFDSNTDVIHTLGYFNLRDRGHATYVCDQLATPELAAIAPRFCTVSGDGRRWRAAANSDGLIPVAAGGAVGALSSRLNGLSNDQPIIAQALAYQQTIGAPGLVFNNGNYTIWCPPRTAIDDQIRSDKSGIPFLIRCPTVLQSGSLGTSFNRRKFDGSDPAVFHNTQYLSYNSARNGTGIYWRGGMFMLVGKPDPRPDYSTLSALHLKGNWNINGGISQSKSHAGLRTAGNPEWYVLNPDGSGWDVTDKPIWAENDLNTGDIIFEGNITIGGFRGELLYQGGNTHGSIYQTGKLTLHDTDGNGFCPGPSFSNTSGGYGTVQMQSLNILNAYQALEGATGWDGFITNLQIQDCIGAGGLMSGFWGPQAQLPDRPAPILTITSLKVVRSGNYRFYRASHVQTADLVDTCVWVSQYDWGTYGTVVQELTITADSGNIDDGIIIFGPSSGQATFNNYFGTVTLTQTVVARVKGFCVGDPVNWYGLLGDGNTINKLNGVSLFHPVSRNPASVIGKSPQINTNALKYLSADNL